MLVGFGWQNISSSHIEHPAEIGHVSPASSDTYVSSQEHFYTPQRGPVLQYVLEMYI